MSNTRAVYMDATSLMFDSQHDQMKIKFKSYKKKKLVMSVSACWGRCGLCLNKHWNFPAFRFLFIYFLSVLFSQYCNASLDITQASLSCSASAESNLVRSAAARRIRLSFFRLLWNVPFFFNIQNTQGSQIADMCEGAVRLLHSFMPGYAKLHIVYLKNTEHFSTIKKHVI